MIARFAIRTDDLGWAVFDRWTGRTVVLGSYLVAGLRREDAEATLRQLNGDQDLARKILQ